MGSAKIQRKGCQNPVNPLRFNATPPIWLISYTKGVLPAQIRKNVKCSSYQNEEINGTYQRIPDVEKQVWCPKVPGRRSETRCPEVFSETGRPARRDACQEPRSQQREKFEHRNVGDSSDGEDVGKEKSNEGQKAAQVQSKAFQKRSRKQDEVECDGPAGPEANDEAIEFHQIGEVERDGPAGPKTHDDAFSFNNGERMTLPIADGKLNKVQQRAEGPDQSSQETIVMSDNHAADAHDDRAGGSHVVCLGNDGRLELDEKVYWRPSYMFNWLKAAGWSIKDA